MRTTSHINQTSSPDLLPLTPEDTDVLKSIFRSVHRNFLRYSGLYVFLLIAFGGNTGLGIRIYRTEAIIPVTIIFIAIFLILLIWMVHHYTILYYTGRTALLKDICDNMKHVFSGYCSAHEVEDNALVYHINRQKIPVFNRYTLLEWKIENFTALEKTSIALHFLPVSRLLLKVVYKGIEPATVSERLPLNEKQDQAFSTLPKKDRPTLQLIHEGIVTEQITLAFSVFLFNIYFIIPPFIYKKQSIRLGNKTLHEVTQELIVGQGHTIVEFL
ncbi:hypothetical protein [Sinomicrobium sp. M5D2P9]